MTNDSRGNFDLSSNPRQGLTVLPDDMLDQVVGGILPFGPGLGNETAVAGPGNANEHSNVFGFPSHAAQVAADAATDQRTPGLGEITAGRA